jgi:hypothetical protein
MNEHIAHGPAPDQAGVAGTLSMSTIGLTSIVATVLVPTNPLAIAIASSRSFASMMV